MYVDEGAELVVTIDIDYSTLPQEDRLALGVEETLPDGFSYVSSSGSDARVLIDVILPVVYV